jgi:hypothetical protein
MGGGKSSGSGKHTPPSSWKAPAGSVMMHTAFPTVTKALKALGGDNGMSLNKKVSVSEKTSPMFKKAEQELSKLSAKEIDTFASGEQSEINKIAKKAPTAHKLLNSAFEGKLSSVMFPSGSDD